MAKKIETIRAVSIVDEGDSVSLILEDNDAEQQTVTFTAKAFDALLRRSNDLLANYRSSTSATTGHLEVHAQEVIEAAATVATGAGKVILALQGDTGMVLHYALKPEIALQLRPELFRAAKTAKKQASQSRH